jgi:hypothetical protein
MAKAKQDGKKKKKKSSQLVIRIEASERDAFVKLCDQMDTTAAREIRRFMRGWVAEHGAKPETAPTDTPSVQPIAAAEEVALPSAAAQTAEKPVARARRKPSVKDVA